MKEIAILGAGSWGTALGLYLARRQQSVRMWSIDQSEINGMLKDGSNERYLPGHRLPSTLTPMLDLDKAIADVQDILLAIPSVGFRSTLRLIKPLITKQTRFICATKGMDADSGRFCNEMLADELGDYPFAAISGPSFAKEVANGLPTAVMIASKDENFLNDVHSRFNSDIFHTYKTDDVIGVEVGAVVKNVIAIATGISDGMQLGTNARSALITCGLKEITDLALALGARAETLVGLAGLGDLILTSSDDQSRNRRLGLSIGKGKNIQEAEKEIGQVVEGKRNAELVVELSKRLKIAMPICSLVNDVLQGKRSGKEAYQFFIKQS